MEVYKEVAKLEARVDVLADALYNYKAHEKEGFAKEMCKDIVERQIAAIHFNLNQLSENFSISNINDHLERMLKESEDGGV